MTPSERRDAISRMALSGQRLIVAALVPELGASRETIRRDLTELDRRGLLRRVHGGATMVLEKVVERTFHQRMRQQVAAKRTMARNVAEGLQPGDSLFIDTATTTLFLAEEISRRNGLIIITNSAEIARLCKKGEGNRILLIGGEFRGATCETLGPMAVAQIGQLRAARAILTVASVIGRGVFDIDAQEAEVARAMIAQADEVTVLADGSKMGRAGVFEVCPLARVGRLVTDAIAPSLRESAEAAGVQVDIVGESDRSGI